MDRSCPRREILRAGLFACDHRLGFVGLDVFGCQGVAPASVRPLVDEGGGAALPEEAAHRRRDVRRKLAGSDDGDRQMVKILAAVLTDGLPAVEAACLQGVSEGVHSADVVINILARQRDPGPAATILTPDALRLRHAPIADCARYDQLRSA